MRQAASCLGLACIAMPYGKDFHHSNAFFARVAPMESTGSTSSTESPFAQSGQVTALPPLFSFPRFRKIAKPHLQKEHL